jgi:pilus assembly protein CpaF
MAKRRGGSKIICLDYEPVGAGCQYHTIEEAYRQIAHNIHLFIYVKLVDETWKGGTRRRYVSEIRQVARAIEHGRPVTHLTYHATGSGSQSARYFPDAEFEAELLPFRRDLPDSTRPAAGRFR